MTEKYDPDMTVDGAKISDPKLSDFFEKGLRHVRVEQGPDGTRRYFSEPGPGPDAADSIRGEASEWFNEPEVHTVFPQQMTKGSDAMTFAEEKDRADRIATLKEWWIQDSASRVSMVAEKAVIYGSDSLTELGRTLAKLQGRYDVPEDELQELAIWSYIVGKIGRWTDAAIRGERVKEDTITDIIAYATMAKRVREAGGWPDARG